MNKFEKPMITIVEFKSADVITTSGPVDTILDHDNVRVFANDIAQAWSNFLDLM